MPQFLEPQTGLAPQFAILITTFVELAALTYALPADRLRRTTARPRVITWNTRTGGPTRVAMGVLTGLLHRPG